MRKHFEKHHGNVDFEMIFKSENSKSDTKIILEECMVGEDEEDDENSKEFIVMGS